MSHTYTMIKDSKVRRHTRYIGSYNRRLTSQLTLSDMGHGFPAYYLSVSAGAVNPSGHCPIPVTSCSSMLFLASGHQESTRDRDYVFMDIS